MTAGEQHWTLLAPDEYKKVEKVLEGLNDPVNPIEIPAEYGGTLADSILVGSQ
jgi:hypothetical protein